jgi:hypothetical protein
VTCDLWASYEVSRIPRPGDHKNRWHVLSSIEPLCLPIAQPCRFATGIDTGCVLGDQLSAVVLPPVSKLRSMGVTSPPTGSVTLESIGGQLVSVRAKRCYKKEDED